MSSSHYISTRGHGPVNFQTALLSGLAPDGGLFLPQSWPTFDIEGLNGASYQETALHCLAPFIGDAITESSLQSIIDDAYASFSVRATVPLHRYNDKTYFMELFHGPSLSFKDVALQILARLFDDVLEKTNNTLTLLCATSGDTGSAAIEACKGRKNITLFVLHPKDKVSLVQQKQMTSVIEPNIHNIAVKGNFDDCQRMVKALLGDQDIRPQLHLSAVNSINWGRIMAQMVYYVHHSAGLGDMNVVVPTGNFGNIFAAHAAQKCGAPLRNIFLSTNKNNVLYRFLKEGILSPSPMVQSISPSMDIQVPSNLERFLFELYGSDPAALKQSINHFYDHGTLDIGVDLTKQAQTSFKAGWASDDMILSAISDVWKNGHYLIDPHTAAGWAGASDMMEQDQSDIPWVFLACADPAKFPETVQQASGQNPPLPTHMSDLLSRPEECDIMEPCADALKLYILERK